MTELEKAARQALEGVASMARCGQLDAFIGEPWLNAVFAALEQQPDGEPVAWQWLTTAHFRKKLPKDAERGAWNPLYTRPAERKFEETSHQPVAPQRSEDEKQWVGLTDKERQDLYEKHTPYVDLMDAIEAKLREKNQ